MSKGINKLKFSVEIKAYSTGKIEIVNPSTGGTDMDIHLFNAIIKHLLEVQSWYNQTTLKINPSSGEPDIYPRSIK